MSVARQNERQARVARASVIAFASVLVAALSHMLAGGNTPTVFAIAASTIVAIPLTLLLTRRSFGVVGMFSAVALTQGLFHSLFVYMVASSGGSADPLPAHAEHFGMVREFVPVLSESAGPGMVMWLSHGVAAVITVWLIRRGDVALSRLARVLTRVFWPNLHVIEPAPVRTVQRSSTPRVLPFASSCCSFTISYRGPPVKMAH